MEKLVELTKKILRRGGYEVREVHDANKWVSSSLRPFVMMNLGYELFRSVSEKSKVRLAKRWYNLEDQEWMEAFREFHKGMDEEELMMLSDYEDKLIECLQENIDKLIAAAEKRLDMFPEKSRRDLALVFTSETIAVVCINFISEGFKLDRLYEERVVARKHFVGVEVYDKRKRKPNDYHHLCGHLQNAVRLSERVHEEMRKASMGTKGANYIMFSESEEFMSAFEELLENYMFVNIND